MSEKTCAICGGKITGPLVRLNFAKIDGRKGATVHAVCNLLRVAAYQEIDQEKGTRGNGR